MSGIKVEGFFRDVGGAGRVTKLRRDKRETASAAPDPKDPIRELADRLHPGDLKLRVSGIRDVSPTARTYRFEPVSGHLPVFQSGQYASFRLKIGDSLLTRPYSISSAPYEARGNHPFFEITVRCNRPYFVPSWLFENVKIGDVLTGALPFGNFYYEPIRDTKNLVALAGGSGIAPFHSMAKEIAHGGLTGCRLTILYGSMKADDIPLHRELEEIEKACSRVKVVHVLSDDPSWTGEKGFLSKELLQKYSAPDSTYFFCGPLPMAQFVEKELTALGVPKRRFRCDVLNNPANVTALPGYPAGHEKKTYRITVHRGIQTDIIPASGGESVAVALERSAIPVDTHCRNGECGYCRGQLLSGEVFVSPIGDGRRLMDREMGWFHPCASWPLSDLEIKIPIQ